MRFRTARLFPAVSILAIVFAGCDMLGISSDEAATAPVGVSFKTAVPSPSAGVRGAKTGAAAPSLTLEGSNGTLTIEDIRLIVSEFELKKQEVNCVDGGEGEDECEKFEGAPTFLDLPLDGSSIDAIEKRNIPEDTYVELEFEVEDVNLEESSDDDEPDDSDDQEKQQQLQQVKDAITQAGFLNWPEDASMVVVGTFTPTGGETQSFTTFIEAEIEVERELNPPLVIDGSGTSRDVTVTLDPSNWFVNTDGTVRDLSTTDGQSIEFELELEKGFTKIEIEEEEENEDESDDS